MVKQDVLLDLLPEEVGLRADIWWDGEKARWRRELRMGYSGNKETMDYRRCR